MSTLLIVFVAVCILAYGGSGVSGGTPPPHTLEEASHRLDMVLNNTRSRENYIRCFMDRGICNKDASNIKHILSEALATNCTNCTQAQRMGAEKFFKYIQVNQPETWKKLTGKYGKGGVSKGKEDDDDDSDDSDDEEEDRKKHDKEKNNSHSQGQGPTQVLGQKPEEEQSQVNGTNSSEISIIF